MAQLSIQELEELIFARADLLTEKDSLQRENYKLKERLAAKDAEIARLTTLHNERLKAMGAVKIVQDTVDALVLNPLADLPYVAQEQGDIQPLDVRLTPAQEQADEHPAKSGWVETSGPDHEWKWAHRSEANGAWRRAGPLWDICAPTIIAAYDRHIQEGGQAQ